MVPRHCHLTSPWQAGWRVRSPAQSAELTADMPMHCGMLQARPRLQLPPAGVVYGLRVHCSICRPWAL